MKLLNDENIKKNNLIINCRNKVICSYCNKETQLVWVHGHFQCTICKYVVESCCEGGEVND